MTSRQPTGSPESNLSYNGGSTSHQALAPLQTTIADGLQRRQTRSGDVDPEKGRTTASPIPPMDPFYYRYYSSAGKRWKIFLDRLRGKGRKVPTWRESFKNIIFSTSLNIFYLLIPVAWVAHLINDEKRFPPAARFTCTCFDLVWQGYAIIDVG